jgi:hypothetical protein
MKPMNTGYKGAFGMRFNLGGQLGDPIQSLMFSGFGQPQLPNTLSGYRTSSPFMNNNTNKGFGLGNYLSIASLLGSFITPYTDNIYNKKLLQDMPKVPRPIEYRANPMLTDYDISSPLNDINDAVGSYNTSIRSNSSNPAIAASRMRAGLSSAMLQKGRLYNTKENIETQLINQDSQNRQGVYNNNVDLWNNYKENQYNSKNALITALSGNRANFTDNLGQTFLDMQSMLNDGRVIAMLNQMYKNGIYDRNAPSWARYMSKLFGINNNATNISPT